MMKITMNLSEQSIDNINTIKQITGVSNRTTAVASALVIAKEILKIKQAGGKIIIRHGDHEAELLFIT